MNIIRQYRDDKAWLTHQLEQRHPQTYISIQSYTIDIDVVTLYKTACDQNEQEHFLDPRDRQLHRRLIYLYLIEKNLGLLP